MYFQNHLMIQTQYILYNHETDVQYATYVIKHTCLWTRYRKTVFYQQPHNLKKTWWSSRNSLTCSFLFTIQNYWAHATHQPWFKRQPTINFTYLHLGHNLLPTNSFRVSQYYLSPFPTSIMIVIKSVVHTGSVYKSTLSRVKTWRVSFPSLLLRFSPQSDVIHNYIYFSLIIFPLSYQSKCQFY